jgi:hypothetical protein
MVLPFTSRAGSLRALIVAGCLLVAHGADAQRAWTPPETLTPPGQQSPRPQIAIDGNGNALVTWIREQGATRQAQAARQASTGSWSPPANLFSPAAATAVPLETSDVALNAAGRGAAVWVRATGSGPSDQMVQAAIFNGTSWRTAANLLPASSPAVRSPRVDVDADGDAIALWVQVVNGVAVVRASRYAVNGTWSAPITISAANESVEDGVALAVDDAGNALTVWTGAAGGVPTLRSARYTAGTNSWTAPIGVAPAGRSPSVVRLAANRAGTAAFLAYRGFDGTRDLLRAARFDPPSGTWSAPVDVSAPGAEVVDLDIAADEQGRALTVWNDVGGTVQAARYDGSWSTAGDRATGAEARDVSIDTDAAGNAVAAWGRWDGTRYRVQASVYSVTTNAWAATRDVSDTSGDAVAPRVRLHNEGTAIVVWQSNSDYAYVRSSRYVPTSMPLLRPAVVTGTTVALTWSPGTGTPPSGYTIVASLTPGGAPIAQLPAGVQTSAVVFARDGGYYVRVMATVNGVLVPSNEIFVVVGTGPVPGAPQDLAAEVNGNVVTLTWAPPANEAIMPVRSYFVAAGSTAGSSNLAFFPTGNPQTTFVTGAVPNGTYWVRIYADSAAGLSPPSADIRVVVGPPPPGAPVLSGGATAPGSVLLQWTAAPAPGAPVTGYQLHAGYQPGQSNAGVITLPASLVSYAATAIPPGTYHVRVVPLSSSGPGEPSNEVVVTVP